MSNLALAFGFNNCQHTDIMRIKELEKMYDCEVVTISELTVQARCNHNRKYIDTCFGNERSSRTIRKVIKDMISSRERSEQPYHSVFAFLDYFWLAQNYYKTNYGTDWLCGWSNKYRQEYSTCDAKKSICYYLLSVGVDTIYLPNGSKDNSLELMVNQYEKKRSNRNEIYNLEWVDMKDNPIWTVTNSIEEQAGGNLKALKQLFGDRGSNTYQSVEYLNLEKPFLKVSLSNSS